MLSLREFIKLVKASRIETKKLQCRSLEIETYARMQQARHCLTGEAGGTSCNRRPGAETDGRALYAHGYHFVTIVRLCVNVR